MNFNYKVIVSKRRKTVRVKIASEKEVIIYSPYRISNKEAEAIINSNIKQIEKLRDKLAKLRGPSILERGWLYILGEKVPVTIIEKKEGGISLKYDGQRVYLSINPNHNQDEVRELIKKWYKKIAKEYLIRLTVEMAEKYNFTVNSVRIKDVKTRWGSCSSKRNINLSYKLIMAPKEVIGYVIVHELCHLKEMNHSEKFWREVSNIIPNYKVYLEHLKKFGHNYEV
jgi:predicted metal-dependent hydrolase